MTEHDNPQPLLVRVSFSLFEGDWVNRIFAWFGLHGRKVVHLALRSLILVVVTWGAVAAAALFAAKVQGMYWAGEFFTDFSAYLQFIIGLPLFVIAEHWVDIHTREASNYFLVSGVLPSADAPIVEALNRQVERFRKSCISDLVCLVAAVTLAVVTISPKTKSECPTWHTVPIPYEVNSAGAHKAPVQKGDLHQAASYWQHLCTCTTEERRKQREEAAAKNGTKQEDEKDHAATASKTELKCEPNLSPVNARLNIAGVLEMCVALPILNYWWLRWIWKIILWMWYLWWISRRRLVISPAHPDSTGGLGFLSDAETSFGLVILAYGVSNIASTVGYEIRVEQASWSLYTVWCPLLLFVIGAPTLFTLPLFMFTKQLYRAKKRAREHLYEKMGERARLFEGWWRETTPDAIVLDDLSEWQQLRLLYQHVEEMRIVPFDLRSFGELLINTLGSLLPLLAYLNLPEPIMKLLESGAHLFHSGG